MPDEQQTEKFFVKVNAANPNMKGADGTLKVGLWEVDLQHPEGPEGSHEVYVAGDEPVEVAATGAVLEALRDERIVKVDAGERVAWETKRDEETQKRLAAAGGQPGMLMAPAASSADADRLREENQRLRAELQQVRAAEPAEEGRRTRRSD